MESLAGTLSGLVLVWDTHALPCLACLRFLARSLGDAMWLLEHDVPAHRLRWMPQTAARVTHCYGQDDDGDDGWLAVPPDAGPDAVLVVDSVTRPLLRRGLASVAERLLQVCRRGSEVARCVDPARRQDARPRPGRGCSGAL